MSNLANKGQPRAQHTTMPRRRPPSTPLLHLYRPTRTPTLHKPTPCRNEREHNTNTTYHPATDAAMTCKDAGKTALLRKDYDKAIRM